MNFFPVFAHSKLLNFMSHRQLGTLCHSSLILWKHTHVDNKWNQGRLPKPILVVGFNPSGGASERDGQKLGRKIERKRWREAREIERKRQWKRRRGGWRGQMRRLQIKMIKIERRNETGSWIGYMVLSEWMNRRTIMKEDERPIYMNRNRKAAEIGISSRALSHRWRSKQFS